MSDLLDPAGVAVFIAVVAGMVALATGDPHQWGLRRIAIGITIAAVTAAGLLLAYSSWWWLGLLWGGSEL